MVSLDYYNKLFTYCKTPFSKSDLVLIWSLEYADFEAESYFEIVMTQEYGEADRIDIKRIQTQHITDFLKNTCILLKDIK